MRLASCIVTVVFAMSLEMLCSAQYLQPILPYNVTGYTFAQETLAGRHLGEDVHAVLGVGTPVRAVADGVVILSRKDRPGYGQYVVISHPGAPAFVSVYGHLSKQEQFPLRAEGPIRKDDVVGYIGSRDENGGYAPHLHFAIYKAAPDGYYHYWGNAPNTSGDDVDFDVNCNVVGGRFTAPGAFLSPPPIIFSNFGLGNAYQASLPAWSIGYVFPGYSQVVANSFQPTMTAALAKAELAIGTLDLAYPATNNPQAVDLWIMNDSGNKPGAVIESFHVPSLTASYLTGAIVSIESLLKPTLNAGSQYWMAANVSPGRGVWFRNAIGDAGAFATRNSTDLNSWFVSTNTKSVFRLSAQRSGCGSN